MRSKILIARAIFPEVVARLSERFDVEANQEDRILSQFELLERVRNKAAIFVTGSERITAEVIAHAPNLKAVCNANVMVTNTPDVLNETTADFAWALLMATARRVTESEHWLRDGHWKQWSYDAFLGADVHGATLGIIGMGRIGQAIARRSMGFDMRVVYHNRSRISADREDYANHATYRSKEALLREADHVVLALPYSPQSHHTIAAAELALMKSSATLINIARGGIVDDAALIKALECGQIAAAGLDVYENEPAFDRNFLKLKNIVLTPHIGSATEPTRKAMANCAATNLIAALDGDVPPNLVNALQPASGL